MATKTIAGLAFAMYAAMTGVQAHRSFSDAQAGNFNAFVHAQNICIGKTEKSYSYPLRGAACMAIPGTALGVGTAKLTGNYNVAPSR